MINDKKINEVANKLCDYGSILSSGYRVDGFKKCAKWMQEELFKELWHYTSEEPKNLEYIIFTSDMFGETYFFTRQRDNSKQSWETEVKCHGIIQWAYRDEIISLFNINKTNYK